MTLEEFQNELRLGIPDPLLKLQPIDTAIIGFNRLNVCIRYVILGMFFFGNAFYYNLRAQVKVYDDGRLEI